jgi:hypothetical protein
MSGSIVENLRSQRAQIESIRKGLIDDLWIVTGLFVSLKLIGSDALTTRSVAEAGRYYTQDIANGVDEQFCSLRGAIDESINLLEAHRHG